MYCLYLPLANPFLCLFFVSRSLSLRVFLPCVRPSVHDPAVGVLGVVRGGRRAGVGVQVLLVLLLPGPGGAVRPVRVPGRGPGVHGHAVHGGQAAAGAAVPHARRLAQVVAVVAGGAGGDAVRRVHGDEWGRDRLQAAAQGISGRRRKDAIIIRRGQWFVGLQEAINIGVGPVMLPEWETGFSRRNIPEVIRRVRVWKPRLRSRS